MRTRAFSSGDAQQEAAALNVSWSDDVFGGGTTADEEKENLARQHADTIGNDHQHHHQQTNGKNEAPPSASASASASMTTELYTTEIVRAMFGPGVGSVVGDYSCSYKRNSGRLYLSTNALCYYSNLFGSENKYIFRLSEIIDFTKIKSSGISIKDITGLDHNFRSFNDRDAVYDIIVRLHTEHTANNASRSESGTRPTSQDVTSTGVMAPSARAATFAGLVLAEAYTISMVPRSVPHEGGTSRTGSSDRRFKSFSSFSDASSSVKWPKTKMSSKRSKKKHSRVRSKSVDTFDRMNRLDEESESTASEDMSEDEQHHLDKMAETPAAEDPAQRWSSLTKEKLKDTALDGVHLSCGLDSFYDKFLADDAPFSFGNFQTTKIGDFELELERWEKGGEENGDKRIIKFRHPLKHKLGPSSASMEKHQFCHIVRGHGILLKSCTYGKGFPAADAFHVEDMWIIEPNDSGGVSMTVLFQVHYSKSTMLRKLIDSNTRQEYTTMYTKYLDMVASALGEKTEPVETVEEGKHISLTVAESPAQAPAPSLLYAVIIMSIVVVALVYYTFLLRSRVQSLEGQMGELKQAFLQIQAGQ